jgi:SAM-dependent methyltransferase
MGEPTEPIGALPAEQAEVPQFVTDGGHLHMNQLEAMSDADLVGQLIRPASPFIVPGQLSQATGRLRVEELQDDDAVKIIKRVGSSLAHASSPEDQIGGQAALSFLLLNYVRDETAILPREAIAAIRHFRGSKNPWVQDLERQNIGKLILLDERNRKTGQAIGLREQVRDELFVQLSLSHEEGAWGLENRLLAYTLSSGKDATKELMYRFLDSGVELPQYFYKVFANTLDFDTMRTSLREYMKAHPESRERLNRHSKTLNLDLGETVLDPIDFYRNEPLESHGPYSELQEKDLEVLTKEFAGRKKVVDVGCGRGRLMLPLRQAGIPVEGVDVVEEYGEYLQSQDPEAVFHVGSMDDLPYEDGQSDGIFVMGRTSGHWKSPLNAIRTFQELRRVLSPEGTVVLDLPDITSGFYAQRVAERANALREAGIWNYEYGDIHSSPDSVHFFDRLMPGASQVKAMALLAGFEAEIIDDAPFTIGGGVVENNLYWRLTPRKEGPINENSLRTRGNVSNSEWMTIVNSISPGDLEEFGIHITKSGHTSVRQAKLNVEDY